MKKLLAVLVASFVLTSCGEKKPYYSEEQLANQQYPAFCIRNVDFSLDGHTVYIDMPYYQWWNDLVLEQVPSEVTREFYDNFDGIPLCQPGDPRLG